ncbi:MAG: ABC transporter permease [Anaerolineaceae bacterium]|jgi:simple sugar transport system permease protein|nr:ABC transporter permease [Anaerolineaceae bacterium]MDD4043021.1 ABC transporter permease [Anaerolineaceae bacterium]MDD4577301.1 ABC transporter permease [Anaerolineaceae bacterium]
MTEEKKDIGQIFLNEVNVEEPVEEKPKKSFLSKAVIPLLAILTGLIIGAILIAVTSQTVWAAFGESFWRGLSQVWKEVVTAYGALITGSLGDPARIVRALGSGDAKAIRQAFNPILESLVQATPYIFAGLAVAVGFRSGLFNIGVEGQLFIGAACATFVGYSINGLPAYIHMPLAFLAGAAGGAFWAFIPGFLKAKTGGHEVINTIMMNWIAFRFTEWLLSGPMSRPGSGGLPLSPIIQDTAKIPQFFASPIRFHAGFFIALAVAWLVWWLLFKTTWGLNLRTVGTNPRAARYAGLNTSKSIIVGMTLSGALAGMAGAVQILAVNHSMALGLSSGYGFDSIALALIGNNHPVGVILSSLLFGTLRNGATRMMVVSAIPIDIVDVIQAIILMFVAAPAIIRSIYRLRKPKEEEQQVFLSGWGGQS